MNLFLSSRDNVTSRYADLFAKLVLKFIQCLNSNSGGFLHTTFDDDRIAFEPLNNDLTLTNVSGDIRLAYYFTAETYQCRAMSVTLLMNDIPIATQPISTCSNEPVYAVFNITGLSGNNHFRLTVDNPVPTGPNSIISGVFVSRPDGSSCTAPHITIAKTPDNGTFTSGQALPFTIKVTSDGTTTAHGVVLNDNLPTLSGQLTWQFVSVTPAAPGSCGQ